jgi:hypothetical protein
VVVVTGAVVDVVVVEPDELLDELAPELDEVDCGDWLDELA